MPGVSSLVDAGRWGENGPVWQLKPAVDRGGFRENQVASDWQEELPAATGPRVADPGPTVAHPLSWRCRRRKRNSHHSCLMARNHRPIMEISLLDSYKTGFRAMAIYQAHSGNSGLEILAAAEELHAP